MCFQHLAIPENKEISVSHGDTPERTRAWIEGVPAVQGWEHVSIKKKKNHSKIVSCWIKRYKIEVE